jgi:aspartyl-tRNA(Asn)/glutamyl-tRNA(Gln) amidotransferase subunit B
VVAAGADVKAAANWVMGEVLSHWNGREQFTVEAPRLAALIGLVANSTVSLQAAKQIFGELTASSEAPQDVAARLGLIQVRDSGALADWVDEVIAAHPAEVTRYRGGEVKLIGFFVGQVMKRSGGKADPKGIQPILLERLKS